MRNRTGIISMLLLLALAVSAGAATGKIRKLLPHYLDEKGRHTLAPSLYERDAYQDHLRRNPELIAGLRFDVQWRSRGADKSRLKLRIEVRGTETPPNESFVIEESVKPRLFSSWSSIELEEEAFKKLGRILAWRVTLWEGETQLAEQKSFLW